MPKHQVDLLVGGSVGAGALASFAFRPLLLLCLVNAEKQSAEVLGPRGRTIGADGHTDGEVYVVVRIKNRLLWTVRTKILEAQDAVEFILIGFIIDTLERGQAVAFFSPCQARVDGLAVVVERTNGAAFHVAN